MSKEIKKLLKFGHFICIYAWWTYRKIHTEGEFKKNIIINRPFISYLK